MGNYNRRPDDRDNRRSFGGNSDRRPSYNNFNRDSSDREREMFPAVCDECGRDCELPFKPSRDKPVYCSDCFKKRGDDMSDRPKRFDDRIVAKQYGSNASSPVRSESNSGANVLNDKILGQLISLNAKFDKIVKIFEANNVKETIPVKEIVTMAEKMVEKKVAKSEPKKEKKVKKAKK